MLNHRLAAIFNFGNTKTFGATVIHYQTAYLLRRITHAKQIFCLKVV